MSLNYKIEFDAFALKQLKSMDKQVSTRINKWLLERIQGCFNPRLWGDALTGDMGEYWRYRIRDYRVICKIIDTNLVVLITKIGDRKLVYR